MNTTGETIFARRVKDLMKKNRFSQKKLCELCGITEAAFSRYMTSNRLPKTEILANIANILHTTSDYLLGNDANYGYDQLEILLASSKDNLSLNQKKRLVEILMDEYKSSIFQQE
jgi:transcriptional regulator with XRE-family HTH domain